MDQIFQSSYSQRNTEAVVGMVAGGFEPAKVRPRAARGLIKAGYGVFKAPSFGSVGYNEPTWMANPGLVMQIPNPGVAAVVAAIMASFGSTAAVQTFSGATLTGSVAGTEMQPARQVTFIFSSHADWDATNATLVGVNYLGQSVTETIAIPNNGNATVTSTNYYRSVTSIAIPAQSGTGGTATVGVSALTTPTAATFRGVAVRKPIKTTVATLGMYGYPGLTSTLVTADFVDSEMVPVLTAGKIWVYSETANVEGDPIYVRAASGAGGSQLGAFRNDADSGSAVLVPAAYCTRDSAAAGPSICQFTYTS